MKYKYVASPVTGLIYRIKPDWKTTGFNEFMHKDTGVWIQGGFSTSFFDKSKAYPLYSLHPRTVKFFEQYGGYRDGKFWKGE